MFLKVCIHSEQKTHPVSSFSPKCAGAKAWKLLLPHRSKQTTTDWQTLPLSCGRFKETSQSKQHSQKHQINNPLSCLRDGAGITVASHAGFQIRVGLDEFLRLFKANTPLKSINLHADLPAGCISSAGQRSSADFLPSWEVSVLQSGTSNYV